MPRCFEAKQDQARIKPQPALAAVAKGDPVTHKYVQDQFLVLAADFGQKLLNSRASKGSNSWGVKVTCCCGGW